MNFSGNKYTLVQGHNIMSRKVKSIRGVEVDFVALVGNVLGNALVQPLLIVAVYIVQLLPEPMVDTMPRNSDSELAGIALNVGCDPAWPDAIASSISAATWVTWFRIVVDHCH